MPWDITGHGSVVHTLQTALASGQVGHAYMLTGPQGVGKARVALRLAQALLCEASEAAPCGVCRSCRRVESGNHPDLHWVMPQGASIRIDQVRDLQSQVALRPYEGQYKVCVLDGADTLTEQAQNSMLKSLEEPPGNGVFILITHNPDAVLSTIHSRCQVMRLQPVAEEAVAELLRQKRGLSMEAAALLAALSHGLPGLALALDPQTTFAQRDMVVGWCTALRQDGLKAVVRIADELDREEDLAGCLTAISIWMRDVWHYHANPQMSLINRDLIDIIQVEAHGWGGGAITALTAIQNATKQLARNANRRLVLDYMLMQFQRGLPS